MRSLNRPEGCISDLAFDELLAGELDAEAHAPLAQHIGSCVRCTERLTALTKERVVMLTDAPSLDALAASLTPQLPKPKPARRKRAALPEWIAGATAVALAASVLLWLNQPGVITQRSDLLGDTRSKGAPHIGVFIKRGERTFRAVTGDSAQAKDLLRFVYSSDQPRYLALLDLDATTATAYFPTSGQAQHIAAGTDVALDFSVELDGSAGEERLHGIFCPTAFDIEPVRAKLQATRALPVLPGCTVDLFILLKEPMR